MGTNEAFARFYDVLCVFCGCFLVSFVLFWAV